MRSVLFLQALAANPPEEPAQDPLAALHDIALPPEVAAWPPAPAWWLLLFGTVLLIALLVFVVLPRLQRWERRYRQKSQLAKALNAEWSQFEQIATEKPTACAAELHCLLKRVARLRGASNLGMSQQCWLQWLKDHDGQAIAEHADWLQAAPYQAAAEVPPPSLLQACRDWVLASADAVTHPQSGEN